VNAILSCGLLSGDFFQWSLFLPDEMMATVFTSKMRSFAILSIFLIFYVASTRHTDARALHKCKPLSDRTVSLLYRSRKHLDDTTVRKINCFCFRMMRFCNTLKGFACSFLGVEPVELSEIPFGCEMFRVRLTLPPPRPFAEETMVSK